MLLTALAYATFIEVRLASRNYDPSIFVVAGERFVNRDAAPPNLHVSRETNGYDGQFYYRLALNPFTSSKTEFGIEIDAPAYRHQRILYPLCLPFHHPGGGYFRERCA